MVTIEWVDGLVRFLDQTRLPLEEKNVETSDVGRVAEAGARGVKGSRSRFLLKSTDWRVVSRRS